MHGNSGHFIEGLWCATLTPLVAAGGIDHPRFVAHARRLLTQGVVGIAPFGTTGEGPSLSTAQRRAGVEALLAAGIAPARILPGTGCASLAETIELTQHAVAAGCVGTLVLLFYNGVILGAVTADYVAAGQGKFLVGWLLRHGHTW